MGHNPGINTEKTSSSGEDPKILPVSLDIEPFQDKVEEFNPSGQHTTTALFIAPDPADPKKRIILKFEPQGGELAPSPRLMFEVAMNNLATLMAGRAVVPTASVLNCGEVPFVGMSVEEISGFRSLKEVVQSASEAYQARNYEHPDVRFFSVENLLAKGIVTSMMLPAMLADNDRGPNNTGVDAQGNLKEIDFGQSAFDFFSLIFTPNSTEVSPRDFARAAFERDKEQGLHQHLSADEISAEEARINTISAVPISEAFEPTERMVRYFPYNQIVQGKVITLWSGYNSLVDVFTQSGFENSDGEPSLFLLDLLDKLTSNPEFQRQKYTSLLKFILLDEQALRKLFAPHIMDMALKDLFDTAQLEALGNKGVDVNQSLLTLTVQYFRERIAQFTAVLQQMPEFQQFLKQDAEQGVHAIARIVTEIEDFNTRVLDPNAKIDVARIRAKFAVLVSSTQEADSDNDADSSFDSEPGDARSSNTSSTASLLLSDNEDDVPSILSEANADDPSEADECDNSSVSDEPGDVKSHDSSTASVVSDGESIPSISSQEEVSGEDEQSTPAIVEKDAQTLAKMTELARQAYQAVMPSQQPSYVKEEPLLDAENAFTPIAIAVAAERAEVDQKVLDETTLSVMLGLAKQVYEQVSRAPVSYSANCTAAFFRQPPPDADSSPTVAISDAPVFSK